MRLLSKIGSVLGLAALCASVSFAQDIKIPFTVNPNNGTLQVSCETESLPGKVQFCTIDSGAQSSLADTKAVSMSAMNGAQTVQIATPAGTQFAKKIQQKVMIGGVMTPVTLEVTSTIRRLDSDLIIGEDFLSQFSTVTIDYKNHVLIFGK